jgi:ABC-type transporter MlaC component
MKTWIGVMSTVIALAAGLGCSRPADRDAQERAQRQLQETRDKLRQDLHRADQQTREDLDKARTQVRQALSQSEQDAQKARERLREHEENRDRTDDTRQ